MLLDERGQVPDRRPGLLEGHEDAIRGAWEARGSGDDGRVVRRRGGAPCEPVRPDHQATTRRGDDEAHRHGQNATASRYHLVVDDRARAGRGVCMCVAMKVLPVEAGRGSASAR